MPICLYGSSPKPGAPEEFYFEGAWTIDMFATLLGFTAGFATDKAVEAVALPIGPQNTAAFVATEPTGELPTPEDVITMTLFPPWALLSGAYGRLGNWLRLQKWQELAQCNANPAGTLEWTAHCILEVEASDAVETIADLCDRGVPDQLWRYRRIMGSWSSGSTIEFGLIDPELEVGDPVPSSSPASNWAGVSPIGTGAWIEAGGDDFGDPTKSYYPIVFKNSLSSNDPETSAQIEVQRRVTTYTPTEPVLPEFSVAPGCPDPLDMVQMADYYCSMQHRLERIENIVRWLASIAMPHTAEPDEDLVAVDPEVALTKPQDAIGAVIEVEAPLFMGRFGRSPGIVYDAGHVSIGTAEGWLPSVMLKHEHQLVWPIPPAATLLGVDLSPGVTANVRWLRAPK